MIDKAMRATSALRSYEIQFRRYFTKQHLLVAPATWPVIPSLDDCPDVIPCSLDSFDAELPVIEQGAISKRLGLYC